MCKYYIKKRKNSLKYICGFKVKKQNEINNKYILSAHIKKKSINYE